MSQIHGMRFPILSNHLGQKHIGFLPLTFILPNELNELHEAMQKDSSLQWIIKPSSSSQGKGIFLTNNIQEVKCS